MSDQLPWLATVECARTSTFVGPGSEGTNRSYSPCTTPASTLPSESPHPFQSHDEPSVITRSALAPTDWYMLPMSELSGSSSGAWFQFTVVSSGFIRVIGSSEASL